jgi:hypothetical protein
VNVIRLMGGLGNQMFQYAFGRVQKNNGIDVCYDDSWMESKQSLHPLYPRPYRLDKFNTTVPFSKFLDQPLVKEHKLGFDKSVLKMDGFNFEGYWQYLGYYKDIIPELRKEFTLKEETEEFSRFKNKIAACNSVSVHIRRGDYLLHRKGPFNTLPLQYYMDALKYIKGDLFVFSDDIPWCKARINTDYLDRHVTYVHLDDYLDFELMKLCRNNITTNSTFSWWAGILNNNPDKVVVCPNHWLGEEHGAELHYPEDWIKIDDYVVYSV